MSGIYSKLAGRYLLGKKGRSFMTLLGIALGVTMVVAVFLTNNAILASYRNMLDAAAGRADLQVSATTGFGFADTLLADASAADGVSVAVPVISSGAPVAAGARKGNAGFYGIDRDRDSLVRDYRLTEGRLPATAGAREVAISSDLASGLGLKTGDQLNVLTVKGPEAYTVTGVFDAAGTVRGSLGPFGVMELSTAQAAFGKQGKLDLIDIVLNHGANPDQVREQLADRLGSQVRVGPPAERTKDMQKLLDSMLFLLTMGGAISLFAGAFIIYTNVSMGVAERKRDLSIARALGMRRGEAVRLVLLEAGVLGALGSALGLVWGWGLSSAMAQQMTAGFLKNFGIHAARVSLDATTVIAAVAVGMGTALFAAYGPARSTVRVSPVEAMRPGEVGAARQERHHWLQGLAGLALVVAGAVGIWLSWPHDTVVKPSMMRLWGGMLVLMLLGTVLLLPAVLPALDRWLLRPLLRRTLGVPGRLAADNLVRQPSRTTATICSLMVGLTFMVAMGGTQKSQTTTFDRWFNEVIGWDMHVSTSFVGLGSQVEMDPAFQQELAQVDGVRLVSPQKLTQVVLADGQPAFLQVFDHHEARQFTKLVLEQGDPEQAFAAMERGGSVIISPMVARRLGIGLGDTLNMPTPTGEISLKVVGIMVDITPYGGTIQMERQDYVKDWNDQTSSSFAVLLKPGYSPEQVRTSIQAKLGDKMPLMIRLNREFWAEIMENYNAFYRLMDGLVWISILVSGLAIANTLFASILERRREFGVMRAVGTKRGEVMRVVVGEAFATGLVGGVIGVAAGIWLQWVMVTLSKYGTGAAADMVVAWGTLGMAAAVALVLAPAVGLLPARWAARMDVVEALRYE